MYRKSAPGTVIDSVDDSSLHPGGDTSTSRAEQAGTLASHARRRKVWSESSMIEGVGIKIERVTAHIIDLADHGPAFQTEPAEVVNDFLDRAQS